MKEIQDVFGRTRIFSPNETLREFIPLRDRIFDTSDDGIGRTSGRIFDDPSWLRVIVRGALDGSDRSHPPRKPGVTVEEWANDDPRDQLQPLFELLVEDGIGEVIHMSPYVSGENIDAVGVRPTRPGNSLSIFDTRATQLQERLLFDRTGRWGFYGSEEEFGLLGGEPEFMERYIERAGGMAFIREKADKYWQMVIDENGYEARLVLYYYELAGWDNPPRKRDE